MIMAASACMIAFGRLIFRGSLERVMNPERLFPKNYAAFGTKPEKTQWISGCNSSHAHGVGKYMLDKRLGRNSIEMHKKPPVTIQMASRENVREVFSWD